MTAHNKDDYEEAVFIYTEILQRDIKNNIKTIIHVHRGMAYYSSGQIDKAMNDFNKALELDPNNTSARYYRAVHSRINKNFDAALKDLDLCIEKEPFNLEYLTARGETYSDAGYKDKAVSVLKYVLSLESSFKPAENLLAKIKY